MFRGVRGIRGTWDIRSSVKPCNIPDDKRPELNGLRSLKSHRRFFLKNSLLEIFYFMSSILSPVLSSKAVVYYHTWFTQTPLTAGEINTYTTSLLMLHVWIGNKRPTTYASVVELTTVYFDLLWGHLRGIWSIDVCGRKFKIGGCCIYTYICTLKYLTSVFSGRFSMMMTL